MTDAVKDEVKKLSKLKQFAKTDESALLKIAEKNVVLRELVDSGNFLDAKEKELAKKIFQAYISHLDFENYSDLSTLSTLVYNEVLSCRVQSAINKCTNKEGEAYISDKLLKAHTDLTHEIILLKEKLGIDKDKTVDEFTALQLLKKRYANHINENKKEFMLYAPYTCTGCGKQDVKPILLRKKVKDFDVLEHPHFSGRFWFNKVAIEMVKSGRITKEEYAKIFQTSVDYVDWCITNEGRIV